MLEAQHSSGAHEEISMKKPDDNGKVAGKSLVLW